MWLYHERVAGKAPQTCPWQAFRDPVVRDVLAYYGIAQTGMGAHLASIIALDPPHHIWLGLQHYAHACALVKAHADEPDGR